MLQSMITKLAGKLLACVHDLFDPFIPAALYGGRNRQAGYNMAAGITHQSADTSDAKFGFFIVQSVAAFRGGDTICKQTGDFGVGVDRVGRQFAALGITAACRFAKSPSIILPTAVTCKGARLPITCSTRIILLARERSM